MSFISYRPDATGITSWNELSPDAYKASADAFIEFNKGTKAHLDIWQLFQHFYDGPHKNLISVFGIVRSDATLPTIRLRFGGSRDTRSLLLTIYTSEYNQLVMKIHNDRDYMSIETVVGEYNSFRSLIEEFCIAKTKRGNRMAAFVNRVQMIGE